MKKIIILFVLNRLHKSTVMFLLNHIFQTTEQVTQKQKKLNLKINTTATPLSLIKLSAREIAKVLFDQDPISQRVCTFF